MVSPLGALAQAFPTAHHPQGFLAVHQARGDRSAGGRFNHLPAGLLSTVSPDVAQPVVRRSFFFRQDLSADHEILGRPCLIYADGPFTRKQPLPIRRFRASPTRRRALRSLSASERTD